MTRWSVVLLALVAAGCFALSVEAGAWWTANGVEIGPHGSRNCFGGLDHCGLAWVGASARWPTLGIGTWGSGLVAAFGLVVVAAAVAGKRHPRLVAKITLVAVVTALAMGIVFLVGFPALPGAALGRGVLLHGIGIGFGVAATIIVIMRSAPAPAPR